MIPSDEFLHALDRLVATPVALRDFALMVSDERMGESLWLRQLQGELLALKRWVVLYLLSTEGKGLAVGRHELRGPVASILPRYGFALHVLRRAVPFAALGFPTWCLFSSCTLNEGASVVGSIGRMLGLRGTLLAASVPATNFDFGGMDLIVATGRIGTIRQLKDMWGERLLGCAGRCAVEIRSLGQAAGSNLSIVPSCSRTRARFSWGGSSGEEWCGVVGRWSAEEALRRLHPSVVLDLSERLPPTLFGYRCIRIEQPSSGMVGFAADPCFGWPGDYTLGVRGPGLDGTHVHS